MKPTFTTAALAAIMLAGCVTVPFGPALPALPGSGKGLAEFQADDASCRQFAANAVAPMVQGATDGSVGTAAASTVIGAAAGALIGAASGRAAQGAAIGGGTGLLVGSTAAGGTAGYSSAQLQRNYDIYYNQCMYARGNRVPVPTNYHERPPGYAGGEPPPATAPGSAPPSYPPPNTPPPPWLAPPKGR